MAFTHSYTKSKPDLSQKYLNEGWGDLVRNTQEIFIAHGQAIHDALLTTVDEAALETWVRDELLEMTVCPVLKANQQWGPVALTLLADFPRLTKALRAGKVVEACEKGIPLSSAVGRTVWSHLSHERTRLLNHEKAHPANQNDTDLERLADDTPTEDDLIARHDLGKAGIPATDIPLMPDITEVREHMLTICLDRLRTARPEHHKAVAVKYHFGMDDGTLTRHRKDTDAARALKWLRDCLTKAFTAYFPT
ncbi:hypothetical protein [Azospirillum griseum]|uniref:Uncharacterized protein n=1 Tax=Azospirillum griseum TaxID=2496639 RepID=A0A3S0R5X4_9PROT|nr:hypothetical protein [Azospirillum griseum]RTR15673.1 hypothetical protein EJ903_22570 [Azospirillum griseum]